MVAIAGDGNASFLACLDEGGTSCSRSDAGVIGVQVNEPSTDTFLPSEKLSASSPKQDEAVMRTYGELYLCPPPRAPTECPASIGPIQPFQSSRRPKELLPQHLADGNRADEDWKKSIRLR